MSGPVTKAATDCGGRRERGHEGIFQAGVSMRKSVLALLFLLLAAGEGTAQDSLTRMVVDTPTAGLLPRGTYAVSMRISSGGTMLTELSLGIFKRTELGFSYGGSNIIGIGDVDWYPRIEFHAKYRLIDESLGFPAVALGYNSQGYGAYHTALRRYDTKSRGFYAAMSKNYEFLGELGLHGGYSVSLEGEDDDQGEPTFFVGATVGFNPDLVLMLEYDLPVSGGNDVARALDEGDGFFNAGLRVRFIENLFVEVDLRNINGNARDADRVVRIAYESPFF